MHKKLKKIMKSTESKGSEAKAEKPMASKGACGMKMKKK